MTLREIIEACLDHSPVDAALRVGDSPEVMTLREIIEACLDHSPVDAALRVGDRPEVNLWAESAKPIRANQHIWFASPPGLC